MGGYESSWAVSFAVANWTIHIRNKFNVDWRGIKMRWARAMVSLSKSARNLQTSAVVEIKNSGAAQEHT
jgi:hypothetical protein